MPHVTLAYSAALSETQDIASLCQQVFDVLAAHPAVPRPDALKVRAAPCPFDLSGAAHPGQVHATLWVLPGRDDATKSSLCQTLCDTLARELGTVGSISVDIQELSAAYTKRVL